MAQYIFRRPRNPSRKATDAHQHRRSLCTPARSYNWTMQSLDYLKQLIPFSSVSNTSNVEVSRWAETTLQELGFETEWMEYTDPEGLQKVCVSGRKGPRESTAPGMAYFCHTDVVPVGSWSFPHSGPWEPFQTADRLYGRGSCDMKGSLACMLAAVRAHQKELKAPLYVVCTADEEIGLRGAERMVTDSSMYREIVSRQPKSIIGEPTLLSVVHAHKGGSGVRVTAEGVAAHSSTGKGVNANFLMVPFLADIKALVDELQGRAEWEDDRFDPPTTNINLGINDHTPALNITPAHSVATVCWRTMPGIDYEALKQRVYSIVERHHLKQETLFDSRPMFTDPDSDYIAELLEVTGTSASHTVSYGTDGSQFQELQHAAVVGPGDIRQAHTDDEWISLDQLAKGTELYGRLINRWC